MKWLEHHSEVAWCEKYISDSVDSPYTFDYGAKRRVFGDNTENRNFSAIMDFIGYSENTVKKFGIRYQDVVPGNQDMRDVLIPTSKNDCFIYTIECKIHENKGKTNRKLTLVECYYGSRYDRVTTKDRLRTADTLFVVSDVTDAIKVFEVGYVAYAPKYDRNGRRFSESRADFISYLNENSSVNEDGTQVAPSINVVVSSTYFDVDGIKDICGKLGIPCVVRAIFNGELGHVDALRKHRDEFRHVLAEAERTILSPFAIPGSGMVSSAMYIDEMMKRGRELFRHSASLGLPQLDAKLGGGVRDGLIVLAAEHGMCKTSLGLKMACEMACAGYHVMFFSLEMKPYDLLARCASRISYERLGEKGLSYNEIIHIVSGGDASQERKQCCQEMLELISKNLHFGSGKYDVTRIRSEVDEAVACGFGSRLVVFVDYLQNMVPMGRSIRDNVEISVDGLAEMCREHRMPVIVISAVNREGHGKAFDEVYLRESGKIEYAATIVLGLQFHRLGEEDFDFDAEKEKTTQEVDIIIRKNRFGDSRGVVRLLFHRIWSAFTEVKDVGGSKVVGGNSLSIRNTRVTRKQARSSASSPRKKPLV